MKGGLKMQNIARKRYLRLLRESDRVIFFKKNNLFYSLFVLFVFVCLLLLFFVFFGGVVSLFVLFGLFFFSFRFY